MEGGRQRLSWTARNGAQRQGKKVEDGRCGDKIERPHSGIGLRSDQPLSRTQLGVPVVKPHGMKTGALGSSRPTATHGQRDAIVLIEAGREPCIPGGGPPHQPSRSTVAAAATQSTRRLLTSLACRRPAPGCIQAPDHQWRRQDQRSVLSQSRPSFAEGSVARRALTKRTVLATEERLDGEISADTQCRSGPPRADFKGRTCPRTRSARDQAGHGRPPCRSRGVTAAVHLRHQGDAHDFARSSRAGARSPAPRIRR